MAAWTAFEVKTSKRAHLLDITERIEAVVARARVMDGVCHVFVPHTTAAVTVNEGADPDVARDIERELTRLVPKDGSFEHEEGNSDSHVKTILVGASLAVLVRGGRLELGQWQAIFLCEWDGPRTRRVQVAVSAL